MIPLITILQEKSRNLNKKKPVEVVEIGLVFNRVFQQVFNHAPKDVQISGFKNGALILNSSSPYVTNELTGKKEALIKAINKTLGKTVVTDIKIRPV